MNTGLYFYPSIDNSNFLTSITRKKEFYDNRISNKLKGIYCLEPQQRLLSNFINPVSPYKSLLLFHQVGLGKTLAAISIAEKFKSNHKIIVLVKNKLLEMNFRKELMGICSNYITPDERSILRSTRSSTSNPDILEQKEEISAAVAKQINKYYTFMTYGYLVNKILPNKKLKTNLDNVVLIVDEVHNLTGNDGYLAVKKFIEDSKNIRVVLLSATPIYDNVEELFEISNLLNIKDAPLLPIRSELSKQGMVVKSKLQGAVLLQDTVSNLTDYGRKSLLASLRGKVSYLLSDEKSFPEKIFNGEPISKIKGSLSVFKCVMSEFQNKWYVNSINNTEGDNTLFKSSSDAATIVYPDGSYGSKGYNTNISKLGNKSIPFLQKDALKIYSTKLYHLIKNLEKSPGPVFIYSNFVNQGGTDLIKKTLEQNGYSGYLVRNNKPKFLLITTALTANQRQKYLNIFNDPSNAYGKTIKIIIGSPLVSEGLTFRAIRQIHILEPYWNLSRMDQIIGRGVRFGSHADLPARERKVNIYLYTAISTTSPSIDLMKYRLGENKDVIIKHIEYEIKKQAIDCKLNKSQNSKSLSQVPDYSRECNYLKCHYSCNGNGNSGSSGSRSSGLVIDDNTYVLENHSPSEYFYILEKIKKLFNETSGVKIFDVDYIVNYIKQDEGRAIDPRNIYIVLNDTLNRSGIIKDNHTLIALGNYYILNDNTIPINQAYFFKLFKKTMKSKVLEEIFDIKEEKKRRTPIIEKEKSKEKTIRSKIYGSFMNKEGRNDNKFRIIDNRSISEAASDKRKIASGKVCTSYQKEDLENIMKFFNIKMPAKISKSTLCLAIEDFMKRNNLVVR